MAQELQDVFKLSGVPQATFVRPVEFDAVEVNLRTPGRPLVIEGPSGIGKTTAVNQGLAAVGMEEDVLRLTARDPADVEMVAALPDLGELGVVVVDDFHRLPDEVRSALADFLKTLADNEVEHTKVVVVGINRAGEALISFARDLVNRVDILRFEANPDEKIREVAALGERALKVMIGTTDEIVSAASGSFYLAQMLCHETCREAGILRTVDDDPVLVEVSFETVRQKVMKRLEAAFLPVATSFAHGTKLRREGRAPYLNILRWLADASEWSIALDREMARHPELKASVGQVVEKGFLESLIESDPAIGDLIHFEPATNVLSAEDPQFVFFLRNIGWNEFARHVGYIGITFATKYDFALSFAGSDRQHAERLFELLSDREIAVFYDKYEQHRILAEDVEDYLGPIYRSEASYVVVLLGPEYPERVWTKFESDQFRDRFQSGEVIPMWFTNAPPGMFDESSDVGGITFDPDGDVEGQLGEISEMLGRRLVEDRAAG